MYLLLNNYLKSAQWLNPSRSERTTQGGAEPSRATYWSLRVLFAVAPPLPGTHLAVIDTIIGWNAVPTHSDLSITKTVSDGKSWRSKKSFKEVSIRSLDAVVKAASGVELGYHHTIPPPNHSHSYKATGVRLTLGSCLNGSKWFNALALMSLQGHSSKPFTGVSFSS